jgi:hypothetical protein
MADAKYRVTVGGATYEVTAPDANTAWQWANMTHAQQSTAPTAAPTPAAAVPLVGTRETAPLKEVKPAGIFDYFTDRQAAIKQDRENRAYLADQMQRSQLKDMETQTGFFDRLGDMFSRGLLSARSGVKDVQAAIEQDPTLKKQFTQEARKFAADKGVEIKGATTEQDVKDNFLRNAIPYIIEKGAESLPQMIASFNPLGVLGVALPSNLGSQAREAAELQGRQDVSGMDLAKVAPGALAVTALDTLGLGGILAAPAKTALGRIGKAALLEGGTEAIQSAIEYANPRVVTGSDIDAGEMFEQAAFGALVGGGVGGGLRGVGEAAAAPFRSDGEVTREGIPIAPEIKQEFRKLAAQQVAAVMEANPDIDQKAAVGLVTERAEELLTQAATNVAGTETELATEGEADVVSDTDTGMDVVGGVGARVAPDFEPSAATTGAPEFGEVIGGGLERSVSGVSVPDVGARAGVSPLETAPATVEPAPKPTFDTTPIFEAETLQDRKDAADMLISDVVQTTPELQGLPASKYNQAANQMAQAAARGEQFDPIDIVYSVAGIEPAAPEVATPTVEEPQLLPETLPKPEIFEDNPGGEWEARKQRVAEQEQAEEIANGNLTGTGARMTRGSTTQTIRRVEIPVEKLRTLEGVNGEQPAPGKPKYDALRKSVDENGFDRKRASLPIIYVNHKGEAFIAEGNNRVAVAAEEGVTSLPVEIQYRNGAEKAQGAFAPDQVLAEHQAMAAPTITPAAAATPQEILADIESFAVPEAQDRGLDPDMFLAGVNDIRSDREPMNFFEFSEAYGFREPGEVRKFVIGPDPAFDSYTAYQSGAQFAQERVDEAQAAAPPAPVETAPAAPAVQEPVQAAMETAPEGGTQPLTDATVDKALSVKLTKGQIKRLEEAAGIRRMKLSNMQKRIAQSRNSAETMSLAGKLMLIAKNPDADVNTLTSLFNSVPPPVLSAVLSFMDTNDVVRLGERAGMANPARINDMVRNEYNPYVNRLMQRASRLSEDWAEFTANSPEGADTMADVMFYSNMVDADPVLAPSAAEYMKIDQKLQDLLAKRAKETDPKNRETLDRQIGRRRGEITRLYSGGEDIDPSGNPVIVKGWNDMPPKGKQIFRKARDHYREDFNEHYRLLMERIDDAEFDEDTTERLKASVEDMFADAMKRAIYFPMKRFGEYWVSIGKGASGEFHMFESLVSQQAFIARLRLAGDIRSISSGFGRDSLRKLRGEVSDVSEALKGILNIIDGGGATNPDLLKDGVFQMYLSSLPEADMRRRFIHRQFKTGFSTDVLRTFATTSIASATQLGRLAYSGKINNLIDQSYAETEENPSKPRLDAITTELKNRLDVTLSGDAETFIDRAANGFAKGTFLWLLSSPKSAFMNLTQLHLTGFPILTTEFGEAATTAMAARYTGQLLTGQRIAYAVRDEEGDVRLSAPKFTAQSSAYIRGLQETDPDRYAAMQKAWLYGEEREVTQSTFTSAQSIYEQSNKPSGELGFMQSLRAGNKGDATKQAVSNTIDGMGALFHHSERIGREIMYMSAFELAYDRNLKQGMDPEVAADEAMATAVKLTNEGMFDFSNWNKPRVFKTPVGRVALQMRSYSFQMTSLLVRSGFNLITAQPTKEGKLAAARVFFGVGAMTTLYAGLRSSQFYVMAMMGLGFYEFLKDLLGDEEEPEKEIEGGYLTEETIQRELMKYADEKGRELSKKDMEYHIRSAWIPETFAGGIQKVFGLSNDVADKLSQVADMGLPALAGVDLSSSVALTNLWHPVDTKSDNAEAQSFEAIGRILLGPSGSFITAWNKFDDEANKGNLDKAVEALLPAAVRNYVKAERLQEEGLVVGKNRDIVLKDPSFYDTYTAVMQSLGFPEAETSRAMQMDIMAGDIEKEIAAEQTNLLDRRYRAILDFERNPTPEKQMARKEIERDIAIYNLNYPSNEITEEDKEKSFQSKADSAAERAGGQGYNPKIPIRETEAEQRAARMLEGQ